MEKVYIEKLNEVHVRVHTEPGIMMEMSEYYTFEVPGAKFMPSYRNKMWDGRIRLLNSMSGVIYAGLTKNIQDFCKQRGYECELDENLIVNNDVPDDGGELLTQEFNTPYTIRDYQNDAVVHALRNDRGVYLSPTASGKSFIIYLISRFHIENDRRVLIVVPTTSLVAQMTKDFIEYNRNQSLDIHQIMSGAEKNVESPIVVSTWQSLFKLPKSYFEQFDVVIGDECHQFKAKSMTTLMEKMPNIQYRYGFTGTLSDSLTNKLVLEGLFGEVYQVTRTKKLINEGTLSDFSIKALILKHKDEDRKTMVKTTYHEEIDWLVTNQKRNKFIRNLAWNLKGNTLVLFTFIEKHGDELLKLMGEGDKNVHYVHGGIKVDEREYVREVVEGTDNNIIVASFGTFAQGINITNLQNIIFASPYKSKIRNLQSIGRVLRKSPNGEVATLYDIVDDLQWKSYTNFAAKHFMERMRIYKQEHFPVKVINVEI